MVMESFLDAFWFLNVFDLKTYPLKTGQFWKTGGLGTTLFQVLRSAACWDAGRGTLRVAPRSWRSMAAVGADLAHWETSESSDTPLVI